LGETRGRESGDEGERERRKYDETEESFHEYYFIILA